MRNLQGEGFAAASELCLLVPSNQRVMTREIAFLRQRKWNWISENLAGARPLEEEMDCVAEDGLITVGGLVSGEARYCLRYF